MSQRIDIDLYKYIEMLIDFLILWFGFIYSPYWICAAFVTQIYGFCDEVIPLL